MTPTSTPPRPPRLAVDPRMRQRVIDVKRAQGRRRLRVVIAVGCAVAVVAAMTGLIYSPVLAVRHIRVSGNAQLSTAQLLDTAGLAHHPLMVDVDPTAIERCLAAVPMVARSTVRRQWPATVTVSVVERIAVAQVPVAGSPGGGAPGSSGAPSGSSATASTGSSPVDTPGTSLVEAVDGTGRVLSGPRPATTRLPILTGLARPGRPGTWMVGGARLAAELAFAAALPGTLTSAVRTVTDTITSGLVGVVVGPGATRPTQVVVGDPDRLPAKVTALVTLLAQVPLATVQTVDIRVPDRPVLTPARSGSTVSTTPGG